MERVNPGDGSHHPDGRKPSPGKCNSGKGEFQLPPCPFHPVTCIHYPCQRNPIPKQKKEYNRETRTFLSEMCTLVKGNTTTCPKCGCNIHG